MWLFIVGSVLMLSKNGAAVFTVNTTDLSKCKVYYTRSESSYKDFYEIADESRENNTLLDFHFSVLAPSNAHILLSPSVELQRNDPAYEIVLGAGGNIFSDIRRAQKSAVKASVRIKDLLSGLDVRSFWIHVAKDGLIEVGREGEELAFMAWIDPDPLPLKVFSFATWPGVEAKWYFDCPRIGNNITAESKEIKKNLTDLQRLRKDLLSYYDPYVRPIFNDSVITTVALKLQIDYVFLDEHKSNFEILGTLKLEWNDEKMKWEPNKYGNIKTLHLSTREIWQPDFVLNNAVDMLGRNILTSTYMLVTHDGLVQWTPSFRMKSWCNAADLGHWPSDVHTCEILLGFAADSDVLYLEFDSAGSSFATHKQSSSEWKIRNVTVVKNLVNHELYNFLSEYNPRLKLIFKLQRNSGTYFSIFFAPFAVISACMLATFLASPFGYLKISLICIQLLMISLTLLNLAETIPLHPFKVPYLVTLYSSAIFASIICLFISISVINLCRSPYKSPVPHFLWKLLMMKLVQRSLFLPRITLSNNYGKLDDVTLIKQDENIHNSWILLATVIDRIAFVVYLLLIVFAVYYKH